MLVVAIAGCEFHHGVLPTDAPGASIDVARDVPPDPLTFCPSDPHLLLCFSFDQQPLPASLANEGSASAAASLTNVTRTASGSRGAAQLDMTSLIFVPMSSEVTGIQALEIWYRTDSEPVNMARMGLVDSNTISNISLFFYRVDPTHQLRCGMGDETVVWDATLTTGSWTHLACVCDAGSLKMYVDGTLVGDTPGPCATGGAIVADGFTIGSNNNGFGIAVSDWLLGAVAGVRLWDVPIVPSNAPF